MAPIFSAFFWSLMRRAPCESVINPRQWYRKVDNKNNDPWMCVKPEKRVCNQPSLKSMSLEPVGVELTQKGARELFFPLAWGSFLLLGKVLPNTNAATANDPTCDDTVMLMLSFLHNPCFHIILLDHLMPLA